MGRGENAVSPGVAGEAAGWSDEEAHSCEIPAALWNLQVAYCGLQPPRPHLPPHFPPLHSSCRAHADKLQRPTGRQKKGGGWGGRGGGVELKGGADTE